MADDLSTAAWGGPPTGKTAGNQGCVTFFCAPPKCSIFLSHHGSIRNEYVATCNSQYYTMMPVVYTSEPFSCLVVPWLNIRMLASRLSPFLRMVVVLILIVTTTTAKGLLNPGFAIGVKSSSPKAILLHPSLTSDHYLETKPMKRRKGARRSKAQTNFAALKNSLLLTGEIKKNLRQSKYVHIWASVLVGSLPFLT